MKFNDKYRIESNRMPNWDYSGNGLYFITLVIQDRECVLGEIKNKEMNLSNFGRIIQKEWYKSFACQSKFHRKPKSLSSFIAGFKSVAITKIDDFIDLNNLTTPKYNRNNKLWQPNYYDHIIRNKNEYYKIKKYIKNNPIKWSEDKFHE